MKSGYRQHKPPYATGNTSQAYPPLVWTRFDRNESPDMARAHDNAWNNPSVHMQDLLSTLSPYPERGNYSIPERMLGGGDTLRNLADPGRPAFPGTSATAPLRRAGFSSGVPSANPMIGPLTRPTLGVGKVAPSSVPSVSVKARLPLESAMNRPATDYTANARRLASQAKTPYGKQQGASLLSLAEGLQKFSEARRRASFNNPTHAGSLRTKRNPSGNPDDAINWSIVDGMRRDVDRMGGRLSTTQGDSPDAAKLNQDAIALRQSMSANGYNPMAGYGPASTGVMRQGVFTPGPAMSLGGSTLGDRMATEAAAQRARNTELQVGRNERYDAWAAEQAAPEAVAARLDAMRERYGDVQPVGRIGAIMARTDLTDAEKEQFIARAQATRAQISGRGGAGLQGLAGEMLMGDQQDRMQRMNEGAIRRDYFDNMRREQIAAQAAPMQNAMMAQMMNQNPDLAVRLLELQQRGQATAAQMQLAQGRLGLDRELGLGELGMNQGRLGLESQRLGFDRDRADLQLALDERLGMGRLRLQEDANAIDRMGTRGQLDAAQETNRLRERELELSQPKGFSTQEMAMVSELAGALQAEGYSVNDAFNEASRRVSTMRSGQIPEAPNRDLSTLAGTGADDPIKAQSRVQSAQANQNSPLNQTFSILGLGSDPTALDIADRLLDRTKKNGSNLSEGSLRSLRQYITDQQSIDPEFLDIRNPAFKGEQNARSLAVVDMLLDPNIPLSDALDKRKIGKRAGDIWDDWHKGDWRMMARRPKF